MLAIDSERILTGFACQLGLLGYAWTASHIKPKATRLY